MSLSHIGFSDAICRRWPRGRHSRIDLTPKFHRKRGWKRNRGWLTHPYGRRRRVCICSRQVLAFCLTISLPIDGSFEIRPLFLERYVFDMYEKGGFISLHVSQITFIQEMLPLGFRNMKRLIIICRIHRLPSVPNITFALML